MQTANWQLCFSDRFTGAQEPDIPPSHHDSIPSKPLRPLLYSLVSLFHLPSSQSHPCAPIRRIDEAAHLSCNLSYNDP